MDMSDMLDVLHYYMETDFNTSSAEQSEARDKVRSIIYKSLYNKEYRFKPNSNNYSQTSADGFEQDISVFDPEKGPTKSYIPPTDFNPDSEKPFGDVLDAPLGS
jgi:hypothetical protein